MAKEKSMRELVDAALRRYNFDATITRGHVAIAYREVVGEFIAKLTRSVSYNTDSHTLTVRLSAAALKNELTYKTSDLIAALNRQLGADEVQHIVFL